MFSTWEEEQSDFDALLTRLRHNDPTVGPHLNLSHRSLDDGRTSDLASALRTKSTVSSIDLRENDVGPAGAEALAEAIREDGSRSRGEGGGAGGVCALRDIDLRGNSLGARGASVLVEALVFSAAFSSPSPPASPDDQLRPTDSADANEDGANDLSLRLDLGGNRLGDSGAEAIAEALLRGSGEGSSFEGEEAPARSSAGQPRPRWTARRRPGVTLDLILIGNGIGPAGATALATCLRRQVAGRGGGGGGGVAGRENGEGGDTGGMRVNLDLTRNAIGSEGAMAFAGVIRADPSRVKLSSTDLLSLLEKRRAFDRGEAVGADACVSANFSFWFGCISGIHLPVNDRCLRKYLIEAALAASLVTLVRSCHSTDVSLLPHALEKVCRLAGPIGTFEVICDWPQLFQVSTNNWEI